jgi:O-antigen/teichoic acid export membrane protein
MSFANKILGLINSGSGRSVRAKKNIVSMFALRGVSIICSFLIVPLTINYVSSYEYGIWLTISSLVAWISFFDVGIGNGLRNKFIEAVENNEPVRARRLVSTAYAIISIIVVSVWAVAMTVSCFIDWNSILNVSDVSGRELLYTVLIALTNFCVLFILSLNRTLLNALQKPALASAFDTATQALLCIVLLLITHFTQGNIVYLAMAMGGTSIFVLITSNIWTFRTVLRDYRPSPKYVKFSYARDIMSLGIMFFFLSVLSIAFYQTNNLIISHYLGPEEVTVYNIAYRYINVLPMVFTIILTPFWSAFTEARVNNDYTWMKSARKRLMQTLMLLGLAGLAMVIISPMVYKVWIKDMVTVPLMVTLLAYLFQMFNMWGSLWTQLLSGLGKLRLQVICSTVCCVSYVPLGCYFCDRYGLYGLMTVSVVLQMLCTSWFGVIQTRKLLNKTATGIWNR